MILHEIFPTVVGEFTYKNNEQIKRIVVEEGDKYILNDVANEVSNNLLHHNESLKTFYEFVNRCAILYCEQHMVPKERYNLYVTKSYFNVNNKGNNQRHHHKDSCLTSVYYFNIPIGKDYEIRFYDESKLLPSSLFSDSFECTEWNKYNSTNWGFTPREGMLMIFPGALEHGVKTPENFKVGELKTGNDFLKYRCSIVTDFIITHSDNYKSKTTHGNNPIDKWKIFNYN
jgi:hypothetical protein